MKKLFTVRDTVSNTLQPTNKAPFYFPDKKQAKTLRDTLNKQHDKPRYCVSKGPDHMGKHGNTMSRNRLQPKKVASYTGL